MPKNVATRTRKRAFYKIFTLANCSKSVNQQEFDKCSTMNNKYYFLPLQIESNQRKVTDDNESESSNLEMLNNRENRGICCCDERPIFFSITCRSPQHWNNKSGRNYITEV
jgi:hypothetical protein